MHADLGVGNHSQTTEMQDAPSIEACDERTRQMVPPGRAQLFGIEQLTMHPLLHTVNLRGRPR